MQIGLPSLAAQETRTTRANVRLQMLEAHKGIPFTGHLQMSLKAKQLQQQRGLGGLRRLHYRNNKRPNLHLIQTHLQMVHGET